MANTTSSALVTQRLVDTTTTILQNRLAPLAVFTRRFSPDPLKPLAVCQIPLVSAGGTAATNATNFEDTTKFVGTKDAVECTPAQITAGGHVTNAELQSGTTLDQWLEVKLGEFSDAITDIVFAQITEANFGTPTILAAPATFAQPELKLLWAAIAKAGEKNCVLDGDFYGQFLPSTLDNFDVQKTGIPGWNNFLPHTRWTAAGTNIRGFACSPSALAVVAGVPLVEPEAKNVANIGSILLPQLGLTVQTHHWYSNLSRAGWLTFDAVIGAAVLDASALKLVKTT